MTAARTLHAQLHLLDRQVVRADDARMVSKADDLELDYDRDGRLYVSALLTGPLALGPRIGGVIGRLMVAVTTLLRPEEDPAPRRIPMRLVTDIGSALKVGGDPAEAALERWTRVHLIAPLPGSGAPAHDDEPPPDRQHRGAMRVSELLGRTVTDAEGRVVGQVADVRLSQDGHLLGPAANALRVSGLVVVPRNTGQLFGYERGPGGAGPWLVRVVVRRLHRGSRHVTWDQVESFAPSPEIRLRVPASELADLRELYSTLPST
ncbi:hypothetical protein [Nonomuraea soli]|uniref:Sporulation protein YlmC with PRC-barrel domain n=1 Tax=Nonomuraea soli TaxID=1032476 RepID=A0A7W0CL12_9ACTN|nr:hypothetical protein [Nonomuraea soli]MBA2893128.1 sporulation protein YlmC with PRC-barrel domain [Nonomuraea soli]